tara:strand:+ start:733 stop:966 length:234 start_codon:yes stop_codon:yes gene_type:complete
VPVSHYLAVRTEVVMLGKTIVTVSAYIYARLSRDAIPHGNMIAHSGSLFDDYATKLVSHHYGRAYVVVYGIVKYVKI